MHPDPQSHAREALLGLHRQLQENAKRLGTVDCDDPNVRAVLQAVQDLNERVADMVAETALLTPLELGPITASGAQDASGQR
ncbi:MULTISPECIES: hypothetical protein [unclassified Pseudomonas]|uniref:hypothetical protein n=1 Tax=unclassified Pseudomonas TaxID=196821 RepID=UPI002361C442|nr:MULTISPECIES: hypothetical protein [unclassified Pseudomonas]MDR6178806.1 hypothetical protein [Pseudomonas sp. SORGH_AS_0211]